LSESEYSYPHKELNNAIILTAKHLNIPLKVGNTWTTDVIYRETKSEIKHYQGTGTATIDMEAATILLLLNTTESKLLPFLPLATIAV